MVTFFSMDEVFPGKTFMLIYSIKRDFFPCCSLHPCLANRARLKALRSLNPSPPPPIIFGSHSLSHFIYAIFLSDPFYPHQKFCTILVISSHKLLGSRKQLIVWAKLAYATTLIRVSLPTLHKSFSFHPNSLLASLSFSCWKVFLFYLPTKDGRPRYFSCCFIISAPKSCLIVSWISARAFLLKNSEVLSQLSCWLVDIS